MANPGVTISDSRAAISDFALAVRCAPRGDALALRYDVPPSGCQRGIHPRDTDHAWHTQGIEMTVPVISILIG